MEKRSYLENCKLVDLRLIKSSSNYLKPDIKFQKLALSLQHEVRFKVYPKKGSKDFYLDLNTELKASVDDNVDYFILKTRFRGDYEIIGNQHIATEKFSVIAELLGHQLYPVVRTFLTHLLTSMGIPFPVPWSVQNPDVPLSTNT